MLRVTRKNDSTPPPAATTEGTRSAFAQAGEEGRRASQRAALLAACRAAGWNLTVAGEALGIFKQSVVKALIDLAPTEYAEAQAKGWIVQLIPPAKKKNTDR